MPASKLVRIGVLGGWTYVVMPPQEGIQSVENGRDIFFPFGISILGGTASQLMKLQGLLDVEAP